MKMKGREGMEWKVMEWRGKEEKGKAGRRLETKGVGGEEMEGMNNR